MSKAKIAALKNVHIKAAICPWCKQVVFLREDTRLGDKVKCGYSTLNLGCGRDFLLNTEESGTFNIDKFLMKMGTK